MIPEKAFSLISEVILTKPVISHAFMVQQSCIKCKGERLAKKGGYLNEVW